MATTPETQAPTHPAPGGEAPSFRVSQRRLRWTPTTYARAAEAGVFRGQRVELIEGEIIAMSAPKPRHVMALELTAHALRAAIGPGYSVRTQAPLDLGRSQPEPDLAVVRGSLRDYLRHPQTALLVIEVSDASLGYDRRRKGHVYAGAGITEYWILNLIDRHLEIYTTPGPDPARRGRYAYADVKIVPADGLASPLAIPNTVVNVADLLP